MKDKKKERERERKEFLIFFSFPKKEKLLPKNEIRFTRRCKLKDTANVIFKKIETTICIYVQCARFSYLYVMTEYENPLSPTF